MCRPCHRRPSSGRGLCHSERKLLAARLWWQRCVQSVGKVNARLVSSSDDPVSSSQDTRVCVCLLCVCVCVLRMLPAQWETTWKGSVWCHTLAGTGDVIVSI